MLKNLLTFSTRTALLAVVAAGAFTAQAQTEKLYLSDVATVEELTSDIFGVPMRIDNVGDYKYEARYYNKQANTPIYFLADKTTFDNAYGLLDGSLAFGTVAELSPIVLPEANTYYKITLDTDNFEYSVTTYVPEEYMDPVIFEQGSNDLNTWWSWQDTGADDWVHAEDAWLQEFYIGVMQKNPEEVIRLEVDPNNKHLYRTAEPIEFVATEENEGNVNLCIHNWHSHGWWNYCTWRFDDDKECETLSYYGGVVKQAYLDWVYGAGNADWKEWSASEDYRKKYVADNWSHATIVKDGLYDLEFDAHLGRAKLVPAAGDPNSITDIDQDHQNNAPAEYYNLQGQRMHGNSLTSGMYIMRQGTKAQKVLIK